MRKMKYDVRIFKNKNFNITGKVLPFDSFRPFIDAPDGFKVNPEQYPSIIDRAEKLLQKEFKPLLATEYMAFKRNGNRSVYEKKYFERRDGVLNLSIAEYVERQGRFTDKIIDLLWMILEETTWVLPAHNPAKSGVDTCLPYAYKEDVDFIDLFNATTGATLATVYFLLKDELEAVTSILCERLLYELDRRIVKPFLNIPACFEKMWWTGYKGNEVNNWCPWIVSNVLTVCALTVKDQATREAIVFQALPMLDNFTSVYHPAGGCDEGPRYWEHGCAGLYNAASVLYDMTGGYIDVFDSVLLKNIGEYEVKVCISGDSFLSFADCPATFKPDPLLIYDFGKRVGSEMMMTFGQSKLGGGLCSSYLSQNQPYRNLRNFIYEKMPSADFVAPEHFFIDGIIVAGSRESSNTEKGLYVALKGGNNNESHNHNDLGNIVVYSDGKPLFIDVGKGEYTKKTFSAERYSIWTIKSEFHNTATVNGFGQEFGSAYVSGDHVYDETSGKLSMELKKAYSEKAGIVSYKRSAVLENSVVTVEDDFKLECDGSVVFNLITLAKPEEVKENSFVLSGRTVSYDPDLKYSIEECDLTQPETFNVAKNWGVENVFRIKLETKTPFKAKKFILTVK